MTSFPPLWLILRQGVNKHILLGVRMNTDEFEKLVIETMNRIRSEFDAGTLYP